MRRVRYQVACSLDGYIASDDGGYDWIVMDPDIDFAALAADYDTLLMGRRTYEGAPPDGFAGMHVVVCSRTLRQEDHPGVRIIGDDVAASIRALKAQPGRDIWLYGGGELFRSLLEADCVDTVEPAVRAHRPSVEAPRDSLDRPGPRDPHLPLGTRRTLGADKGYDTSAFVAGCASATSRRVSLRRMSLRTTRTGAVELIDERPVTPATL